MSILEGKLDRRGALNFWNRRHCVLNGNQLSFFLEDEKQTPEKSITIGIACSVTFYDSVGPRFVINTGKQEIHLRAVDRKTASRWVTLLRSCCYAHPTLTIDSFQEIAILGRGFYGKVTLCEKMDNGKLYAIKSIHKKRISPEVLLSERNTLVHSHNPFIVQINYAFQDEKKVYLALEYVPGGDLHHHISQYRVPLNDVKIYVAEIAIGLNYLHSNGIVYRDLKSENVLIDETGHLKLTDFGLSKQLSPERLTSSFCGTNEYIAPEIIKHQNYGIAIDWWALGILTYELIFGRTPFKSENSSRLFKMICEDDPVFPEDTDQTIILFISGLLCKKQSRRMRFNELKQHPFFDGLDFQKVSNKEVDTSFKPIIADMASNFSVNSNDKLDSFGSSTPMPKIDGFSYNALSILPPESVLA